MKNLGKKFEEDWRKSVPENVFFYRFRDSSGAWSGNNQLRFTPSNIADNLLFYNNCLFLNELKEHKGKSIPLDKIIGNKTKEKQINDLKREYYIKYLKRIDKKIGRAIEELYKNNFDYSKIEKDVLK